MLMNRKNSNHLLVNQKMESILHYAILQLPMTSDHLPEYALKKKVRWSMNSKQGTRYIKEELAMN